MIVAGFILITIVLFCYGIKIIRLIKDYGSHGSIKDIRLMKRLTEQVTEVRIRSHAIRSYLVTKNGKFNCDFESVEPPYIPYSSMFKNFKDNFLHNLLNCVKDFHDSNDEVASEECFNMRKLVRNSFCECQRSERCRVIIIEMSTASECMKEIMDGLGTAFVLIVPITSEGEAIGYMGIEYMRPLVGAEQDVYANLLCSSARQVESLLK